MKNYIISIILLCTSFVVKSQTRYVDSVFENVSMRTFNYSVRDKDTLKVDIYEPVNDSIKNRAVMVIIHGGGFTSGKRNDNSLISTAESITKKGFVVAAIDYRLVKDQMINCSYPTNKKLTAFTEAAEDLLSLLAYLTNYKSAFGIDSNKIILFGASAGAETALNVAYNRPHLIKNQDIHKKIKPAAVISISGSVLKTDFITSENAIPAVLYHGTDDKVVPYSVGSHQSCLPISKGFLLINGSKVIAEKLENQNTSFLFYTYLNKAHNIFNLPEADFHQAFVFLNKVVFQKKFYQSKIVQ